MEFREKFTCCCRFPKKKNVIFIGTDNGQIYRVQIKEISDIPINTSDNISLIDLKEPFKAGIKPFYSYVRALKILDNDLLISISSNGGIKILNVEQRSIINLQQESNDTRNRLWRILIVNPEKFITVGSYGKMQIWEKIDENWNNIMEKRHGSPSFFCLNWYKKDDNLIITNDYRGNTELWNLDLISLESWNLSSNLQELIKVEDKLVTVSHFGDTIVYQEKDGNYFQIERFNCSRTKSVSIIRSLVDREGYIAGFKDKLFTFNNSFTEYKSADVPCIDILSIDKKMLILTPEDLILFNPNILTVPEHYIKYKYIHVGFVGNSRSGKTTLCQRLIKDKYIAEIPSSLGTHIWFHELSDKQKIYYIDMAGQESELPYYLPKLKTCQIIFVVFRHNQAKNEFLQAIGYFKILTSRFPDCQIFLIESMIDQREGISDRLKEKLLKENGIALNNWIKVSAKTRNNIENLFKLLQDDKLWNIAYPITESTINNAILSILQTSFETEFKYTNVKEMQKLLKRKYGTIKLQNFRQIIEKLANEGLLFYLPESDNILLDTADNQLVQSEILKLLHEENGFIMLEKLIELSIVDLGDLEFLNEYIYIFLHYLEKEELALLISNKNEIKELKDIASVILWEALEEGKRYNNMNMSFKTFYFKLKNPLNIIELLDFATKKFGKIVSITRSQISFEGSPKIIFELDDIKSSLSDFTNITVNIKASPEKEAMIFNFLKNKTITMSGSGIIYSLDKYESLINRGECEIIEFKASFKWDIEKNRANKELPEMVTKAVCAFSNSSYGGVIFIGVKNDKSIYGIENDVRRLFSNSIDIFQQEVAKKIREDLGQGVIYNTELIEIEMKKIYIVDVKPSKEPIYFKNSQYFIRRGSSNHNCTPKETQEHIRSRFG